MQQQSLRARNLSDYSSWLSQQQQDLIASEARYFHGKRIYEINATATGGGVMEMLRSKIPLMRGLGIDARWLVLPPDDRFFAITKQLHNALQGGQRGLPKDIEYYDTYTQKAIGSLPHDGDLYILHDPQTLGLIPALAGKPVIWRCHIDLTDADLSTFAWLRKYLQGVDRSIFSLESYTVGINNTSIVYPSIDPLEPKNMLMDDALANRLISNLGIDTARPFITQISRYDIFKDPIGALEVMRRTQAMMPGMQCVLLGNYADDDPEGDDVYKQVVNASKNMPDTHILVNVEDNERVVNAMQSRATAVIQYSSREGFGLTVTEAMWKGALVCARPVGGIKLQIADSKTGVAFTGAHQYDADRLSKTLQDRSLTARIGAMAHDHVERNFITPVMLLDYLKVYKKTIPVPA